MTPNIDNLLRLLEQSEARTRELEAALSVAREALERIGGILPNPMMEDDEVSDYYERLARRALLRHTTQKEAERIRAMEEVIEAARIFVSDEIGVDEYYENFAKALKSLDEREG